MPIKHDLWKVSDQQPQRIASATLPSEELLEKMIVAEPSILSPDWMIVGRQAETGRNGGRIDLLALEPDGTVILIELKRDKTPRDVVAQALDYASWVETLEPSDIGEIYEKFSNGRSLDEDFQKRFNVPFDAETLNYQHRIVIVAAVLDAGSERIVSYLNMRGIWINVLQFQVFNTEAGQLLSRAWLIDPDELQADSLQIEKKSEKEEWNKEYYVNFGDSASRNWDEARQYGFISAGGSPWFSGTLKLLCPGDLVWVKVPPQGFVGVGRVRSEAVPAVDFRLPDAEGKERPALDVLTKATYHRNFVDDPAKQEYFVSVEWVQTRSLADAVRETGMFGNQNTVCAPKTPKWRHTVEKLKTLFPEWNKLTA